MTEARFGDSIARRSAVVATALKLLLLLTFVVAYLNPVLRASEESIFTAFRLLLPLVGAVFFVRFAHRSGTRRVILCIAVVLAYSLVQMTAFGLLSDGFIWSYLINVIALIVFIFFIHTYQELYGRDSLFRHLYFWYAVLVIASIHQLLTGFAYPNVEHREGVARIFHGQENDASLALAAFVPILLQRSRHDPLAVVLLVAGVCIIYLNDTRGVLIGVAAYPVMLAVPWLANALGRRAKVLKPLLGLLILSVLLTTIGTMKDVPIELANKESSLGELVVEPLAQIAAGEMMDAELTSINLRVTMTIVGLQQFFSTFGFGIGPGASTHFVEQYYSGIATSMHVFPLQLLTEYGWLFLAVMLWITAKFGPRLGWRRFVPLFFFFNLVTISITAGAITNYYFFACAAFALTAPTIAKGQEIRPTREPNSARVGKIPASALKLGS